MPLQTARLSLLNRIARVLLCLVFIQAVIGKLTGFAGVAGAIAAKGLPLAPHWFASRDVKPGTSPEVRHRPAAAAAPLA